MLAPLPRLLGYQSSRTSRVRRLRRAVRCGALLLLACIWPMTQLRGVSWLQILAFPYHRTQSALSVEVTWTARYATASIELGRTTWASADVQRWQSQQDRLPQRLSFPYRRLDRFPARVPVSSDQLISSFRVPCTEVSGLGIRTLWHGQERTHTDIWTTERASYVTRAMKVVLPSWVLAVVSIVSTVLLCRDVRRWTQRRT
jgi:hypothetical protein